MSKVEFDAEIVFLHDDHSEGPKENAVTDGTVL